MIWSVLIKDVVLATLWLLIRAIPFYLVFWLFTHTRSDAPMYLALFLNVLGFAVPFILVTWITVAVPALFWRYRSTHQTRLLEREGGVYRQVKIFGFWFFIRMTETGTGYYMCSNHWFSADTLKETYYDRDKFSGRFETFINAWRFGESSEVLKYDTFEGGRLK